MNGSRERFEQTKKAVKRLNDVHTLIMFDCEDWKPPSVKSSNETSDPTANRAIYNVDELSEKLESLRKEEAELTEFIGVSLAIIAAVKNGLGEIYGYLLEWRYIDCSTWTAITADSGIAKSTGHYLLSIAFDWIDSIGITRLLKGDTDV